MSEIQAETLVVRGDNDNPAYITLTDRIGRGIKGARVLVISGGTHFINLERPKEFNHAVLEFLGANGYRSKSPAD